MARDRDQITDTGAESSSHRTQSKEVSEGKFGRRTWKEEREGEVGKRMQEQKRGGGWGDGSQEEDSGGVLGRSIRRIVKEVSSAAQRRGGACLDHVGDHVAPVAVASDGKQAPALHNCGSQQQPVLRVAGLQAGLQQLSARLLLPQPSHCLPQLLQHRLPAISSAQRCQNPRK